jgi:hypothetical protein
VAEANMMGLGEAFAALGHQTWISTFCPFFDWKVLRRIAVGQQERMEAMAAPDGWLGEGHGLDLVMLATAANFETRTNGATHMANDDITIFDGLAHLQIVDISCPQQMLSFMCWCMAGNRGLVYVRVMRTPSAVLYDSDYEFEFGRGHVLRESPADRRRADQARVGCRSPRSAGPPSAVARGQRRAAGRALFGVPHPGGASSRRRPDSPTTSHTRASTSRTDRSIRGPGQECQGPKPLGLHAGWALETQSCAQHDLARVERCQASRAEVVR